MSGKRDKKRKQRRRADQERHASERRVRRREGEALARTLRETVTRLETLAHADGMMALECGERLAEKIDPLHAVALADALCDCSETTIAASWWAGGLLVGAGEDSRAEAALSVALETLGDVRLGYDAALLVAQLRLKLERPAEAMELAFELVDAEPDDEEAQHLEALSRYRIELRADADKPFADSACPCGRGTATWEECCRPREEWVMTHLHDRSLLYATRFAVGEFMSRSGDLAEHLARYAEEWATCLVNRDDLPDFMLAASEVSDPGGHDARQILALESAWLLAPHEVALSEARNSDDDSAAVLARFADDKSTPSALSDFARRWQETARCGLWQVADTDAGSDLWLLDILTGDVCYVAMAPEQLEVVPRWSVLAGWIGVDRGVWRSGGAFVLLSPDEADVAVELVVSMTRDVAQDLMKERPGRAGPRLPSHTPDLPHPPPHGVLSGYSDGMDPTVAHLHHTVLGVALAEVISVATEARHAPVRLHNTDQEPMELLRAIGWIDNPAILKERLLSRADFDCGAADERIAWKGREMPALEAETSHAQARAWAAEEGLELDGEAGADPRHWIRGVVEIDGSEVRVEVNSRARLEAILGILGRLGADAFVVDRRFDPSLDLPWTTGWPPVVSVGSPEAEEAWRRHWLDEPLPALGDRSPREVVSEPQGAAELERLLRQFEFGADLAARSGERPLDVGRIRRELGHDGRPFEV
jgi:hypothetical protein